MEVPLVIPREECSRLPRSQHFLERRWWHLKPPPAPPSLHVPLTVRPDIVIPRPSTTGNSKREKTRCIISGGKKQIKNEKETIETRAVARNYYACRKPGSGGDKKERKLGTCQQWWETIMGWDWLWFDRAGMWLLPGGACVGFTERGGFPWGIGSCLQKCQQHVLKEAIMRRGQEKVVQRDVPNRCRWAGNCGWQLNSRKRRKYTVYVNITLDKDVWLRISNREYLQYDNMSQLN